MASPHEAHVVPLRLGRERAMRLEALLRGYALWTWAASVVDMGLVV